MIRKRSRRPLRKHRIGSHLMMMLTRKTMNPILRISKEFVTQLFLKFTRNTEDNNREVDKMKTTKNFEYLTTKMKYISS